MMWVPDPRLASATITACSMEVPLEDFCHLPQQLGCSLERIGNTLTLISDQPGCAMHFEVEGLQAQLEAVEVGHDPEGRFLRDVVGLALQLYSGYLEAKLTWSPQGAMAERVLVRAGETTHPLPSLPMRVRQRPPRSLVSRARQRDLTCRQ